MPHKRAKEAGKLIFFDNKTAPRSIDRFGVIFKEILKSKSSNKLQQSAP